MESKAQTETLPVWVSWRQPFSVVVSVALLIAGLANMPLPSPYHWLEPTRTRKAVDRLRGVYGAAVSIQIVTVILYEIGVLPNTIAAIAGTAPSLAGPLLSFLVSLHIVRHRPASKAVDVASVALTYVMTCLSFAVVYLILWDNSSTSFSVPVTMQGHFGLGEALYFSIVTITTTGYGDIAPVSGVARFVACWEICTGLLYQVFVFSLAAALNATPHESPKEPRA